MKYITFRLDVKNLLRIGHHVHPGLFPTLLHLIEISLRGMGQRGIIGLVREWVLFDERLYGTLQTLLDVRRNDRLPLSILRL